jgi:CBS domain-containing protein
MKSVRDVMSADPVAVRQGTTFKEIAGMLREFRVSAFPVVDDDRRVVGVVSEADMLAGEALAGEHRAGRVIAGIAHRRVPGEAAGTTAGELMTSPAVTVTADDTVTRAIRLMYRRGLKRLPVVDADGRLTGIVSRTDILAVFDRPDEEIRTEIVNAVIPRFSEPTSYSVIVKNGIVTLEGMPETIAIGRDVLAHVRHVQGVVAVRDRLATPPPEVRVTLGPYF